MEEHAKRHAHGPFVSRVCVPPVSARAGVACMLSRATNPCTAFPPWPPPRWRASHRGPDYVPRQTDGAALSTGAPFRPAAPVCALPAECHPCLLQNCATQRRTCHTFRWRAHGLAHVRGRQSAYRSIRTTSLQSFVALTETSHRDGQRANPITGATPETSVPCRVVRHPEFARSRPQLSRRCKSPLLLLRLSPYTRRR